MLILITGNLTKDSDIEIAININIQLKMSLLSEINETEIDFKECIIHTEENIDLIPSNIGLSGNRFIAV